MPILIFFLVVIGFIGLFVGSIYLDIKSDQRKWKEREDKDNAWLTAELIKPRFRIVFRLVEGRTMYSEKYEPWQDCPGSVWNIKNTSEKVAKAVLVQNYKDGFFYDEKRITYPACNVAEAYVEEVKDGSII